VGSNQTNPNYYVHFSKLNDNKKRTVTFINETQPKVAGSTLKVSERRALVREESKKKREVTSGDSRNTEICWAGLVPLSQRSSQLVREPMP
jgi:hypothetical protein